MGHGLFRLLISALVVGLAGCAGTSPGDRQSALPGHEFAAVYQTYAVAADHPVASAAGAEILAMGGNAVDAAVAVGFTLSVVRPYSCGIGGGGFMLIALPDAERRIEAIVAIDARETAPRGVKPDHFVRLDQPEASRFGVHASGVPGMVAGWMEIHERWGRLDRRQVLQPAIRAAREGVIVDAYAAEAIAEVRRVREARPDLRDDLDELWRLFCASGTARVGDRLRNPDLARVLEQIAEDGAQAFYRGEIAERMSTFMAERGGTITLQDLAEYRPRLREPLELSLRAGDDDSDERLRVVTMPPPSGGGLAMLQMLNALERIEAQHGPAKSDVQRVHRFAHVMQHAFADRAVFPADPDFAPVPISKLLSPSRTEAFADSFDPSRRRTVSAPDEGSLPAAGGTSHFSVIDGDGMAVAATETINLLFGSMMVVPGLGFPLNNEMDDFTTIPGEVNAFGLRQSDANLPAPGKRPLSSMTPTIVLDAEDRVIGIIGASGGPRIISSTIQVLVGVLYEEQSPRQAMIAPRMHHQWLPDRIDLEEGAYDDQFHAALAELGYPIGTRHDIGHVQAIFVHPDGLHAISDPRKGGRPAGR